MERKRTFAVCLGTTPRRRILGLVILGVALVLWCAVIFSFSAQNAVKSDATSDVYSGFVLRVLRAVIGDRLSPQQILSLHSTVSFLIRKLAHFTVYTVLGMLSCLFALFLRGRGWRFPLGWLLCVLYACSDELHQSLVPGRSCQPTDVGIDSAGALLGFVLILAATALILHRRAKKGTQSLPENSPSEKEKTI